MFTAPIIFCEFVKTEIPVYVNFEGFLHTKVKSFKEKMYYTQTLILLLPVFTDLLGDFYTRVFAHGR